MYAPPKDFEAIDSYLVELQTLLEEMDPEAEEKVAALMSMLVGTYFQDLMNLLSKQVGEF